MKKFHNIVIKYGGSVLKNTSLKKQLIKDIIALKEKGIQIIIVHGGGGHINEVLEKMGKKPKFVHGLRVTDKATMEIVEMVLSGKVNKEIVGFINKSGGKAVGLSGKDANLILARKKKTKEKLGFVGKIQSINPQVLDCIKEHFIPVVSSIGVDRKEVTYNINADEAAAGIAGAIKADRLILLTDVDGVLMNKNDPWSSIPVIRTGDIQKLIKSNIINEGMIPKLKSCVKALKSGVKEVDIVKGTEKHILLKVIQGHKKGTRIII